MPKRTRDYRDGLLEDLKDPVAATDYLDAAAEESEQMFLVALRDVADARTMARVASDAGVAREAIYRMLSDDGNPRLNTLSALLRAVGLRLSVKPLQLPEHPLR